MSKAEKTKAFIIEQSAQLFNKKGYADTSLSDIQEVTGLTKGSIYGNFIDKNELAVEVYLYNVDTMRQRLRAAMAPHSLFAGKIKAITSYYKENWDKINERGGCPILNAATDADDNNDFLRIHVRESIQSWTKGLTSIITAGKESGEFKPEIDANEYAYLIFSIIEGGILLSKIMNNPKHLFSTLNRVDRMVDLELNV